MGVGRHDTVIDLSYPVLYGCAPGVVQTSKSTRFSLTAGLTRSSAFTRLDPPLCLADNPDNSESAVEIP